MFEKFFVQIDSVFSSSKCFLVPQSTHTPTKSHSKKFDTFQYPTYDAFQIWQPQTTLRFSLSFAAVLPLVLSSNLTSQTQQKQNIYQINGNNKPNETKNDKRTNDHIQPQLASPQIKTPFSCRPFKVVTRLGRGVKVFNSVCQVFFLFT